MLIHNPTKLQACIRELGLNSWFSTNVEPYLELHRFRKDEFIFTQFDKPNYIYFFVSGKAKVHQVNKNGSVTLIKFYVTGDLVGDLELLDIVASTASLQAIEEVLCIGINTSKYKDLLLNDVIFLKALATQLGKKLLEDTVNFSKNQSYAVENRLAAFILTSQVDGCFNETLTEVADYLGTSYRHLLRVLASLCSNGYLSKSSCGYQILERKQLEELANHCL
jgi:CRP-like cAMP-binding protein